MFKDLIEKTKKRASEVISQKPAQVTIERFPSFEELAIRSFKPLSNEIWKYSIDELYDIIQKYDAYINQLRKSYNEMVQQFQPHLQKFEMLEKERRRQTEVINEKESYIIDLESSLAQLQGDLEEEIRKNDVMKTSLKQVSNEKDILQSQIAWNNEQIRSDEKGDEQMEDELEEELSQLEKGKGEESESLNQRIATLTSELQQQVQLNNKNLLLASQQQQENEQQMRNNNELNMQNKSLLQQLVDQQRMNRNEQQALQRQIVELRECIKQKELLLDNEKAKEEMNVQKNMELQQAREKILEQIEENNTLSLKLTQANELLNSKDGMIAQLQRRREVAIEEIHKLNQCLEQGQVKQGQHNYSLSLSRIQKMRNDVQFQLLQMKGKMEQLYKAYVGQISSLYSLKDAMGKSYDELLQLEARINGTIICLQNLADEIEDAMDV